MVKSSSIRIALLGGVIATSVGIGYAISAQPHMGKASLFFKARAANYKQQRPTRAVTGNGQWP